MLWKGGLGAQGAPSTAWVLVILKGFKEVTSQLRPEGGVLQQKRGSYSEGGVQGKSGPALNQSLRIPLPSSLNPAGTPIPTILYGSHQRKGTPRFFLDCVFKSFQTRKLQNEYKEFLYTLHLDFSISQVLFLHIYLFHSFSLFPHTCTHIQYIQILDMCILLLSQSHKIKL